MSWQAFYLGCFGVGFVLSLVSFLMGALHLHLPVKWHFHGIAGKGVHSGAMHSVTAAQRGVHHAASHFPLFNSASLMIFLAWFGGVGFLLTTHARLWFLTVLGLATVAGLCGAALVATFMVKVLDSPDAALEPMDFQMVGAVGKVNIAIRANGTGEIIYVQGGTRRSVGARSEDGSTLEKGAEVVVARYDHGIAYVRHWDEFTKEG
jgi:membrane protein implicated in regulation of membrane protease activity